MLTGAISRNSGGLFFSVKNLAQCLNRNGVQADILGYADSKTSEDLASYEPLKPIIYDKKMGAFGYTTHLPIILEDLKPDILHPQYIWTYSSKVTLSHHKKNKTPVVITPRGMLDEWAIKNSVYKKKIVGTLFEYEHLRKSACFHALCKSEAKSIRAFGLKKPIAIIPNGVTPPNENEILPPPSWAEDKSWAGAKICLFLSRIHPKKGLELLIQAWADQKEATRKENWKLAIAGWGDQDYILKLKDMVSKLNLDKEIKFIGSQYGKNKSSAFKNASAFILPSYSEGLPMAVLESWSYGLPSLITPQCNIEIGFERNLCIKIETTTSSVGDGLLRLFQMDDQEMDEMSRKAKLVIKDKFDWEIIARDMKNLYEHILGGKTAAPIEFWK